MGNVAMQPVSRAIREAVAERGPASFAIEGGEGAHPDGPGTEYRKILGAVREAGRVEIERALVAVDVAREASELSSPHGLSLDRGVSVGGSVGRGLFVDRQDAHDSNIGDLAAIEAALHERQSELPRRNRFVGALLGLFERIALLFRGDYSWFPSDEWSVAEIFVKDPAAKQQAARTGRLKLF